MRSAPSLTLEPRASRIGPALLLVALLLALCSIWLSDLMVSLQWALSVPTVLVVLHRARKTAPAPSRAVLQSDGVWMLELSSEQLAARLDSSTLLAGLISLSWRIERDGKLHTLLLWPDALSADVARRLRVWLRGSRAHATSPAPP